MAGGWSLGADRPSSEDDRLPTGRRPDSFPEGTSQLRDSAGIKPDFALAPPLVGDPRDPGEIPGTAVQISRPAHAGARPTLGAMKRPGMVLAVFAALAAVAAAVSRRPIKHPEPEGRWEPLERSPVER